MAYGEKQFVQALVPLLISRLPDPFSPTEEDMKRVGKAAETWAGLLVQSAYDWKWIDSLLDEE